MILDSNIVIYAAMPAYSHLRDFLSTHIAEVCISSITKVEVLGYHRLEDGEKRLLEGFLSHINTLPITEDVIQEAVRLRQLKKMSLGDALIAASAIVYNKPLLTNNEADFSHIPNMLIIPLSSLA